MKRTKWYHLVLYTLIIVGIVIVIFSGTNSQFNNISLGSDSKITSLEDWSFSDSKFYTDLPDSINDYDVICFKSDLSFVKVYIDDKLIYSFGDPEQIPFGKTPGSIWNIVELEQDYSGETITISIDSPYEKYANNFNPVVYGDEKDIILYILKQCLPLLICSIITFCFGILLLFLSLFVYRDSKTIVFQALAMLMIITSIWGVAESWFLQFYIGNAFLITQICFFSFFLLPLVTIVAIGEMGIFNNKKLFIILFIFDTLIFISTVLLQLFNIADFFETVFLIHIALFINAFSYFTDFFITIRIKKFEKYDIYAFTAFGLVFVFSGFDFFQFYIFEYFGNGFFYRIGMLLFILIFSIWIVKRTLHLHYDNLDKAAYKKIAHTDDLTGLSNRRAFDECLRTHEMNKEKIMIVFIDMDNLKTVNDMRGHAFGDEYLIIAADLLKEFEEYGACCFRIGGDEFCVIGKDLKDSLVDYLFIKINQELGENEDLFGIKLSMSYGYSTYDPEKDINIFHSLSRADKAMYDNKKS